MVITAQALRHYVALRQQAFWQPWKQWLAEIKASSTGVLLFLGTALPAAAMALTMLYGNLFSSEGDSRSLLWQWLTLLLLQTGFWHQAGRSAWFGHGQQPLSSFWQSLPVSARWQKAVSYYLGWRLNVWQWPFYVLFGLALSKSGWSVWALLGWPFWLLMVGQWAWAVLAMALPLGAWLMLALLTLWVSHNEPPVLGDFALVMAGSALLLLLLQPKLATWRRPTLHLHKLGFQHWPTAALFYRWTWAKRAAWWPRVLVAGLALALTPLFADIQGLSALGQLILQWWALAWAALLVGSAQAVILLDYRYYWRFIHSLPTRAKIVSAALSWPLQMAVLLWLVLWLLAASLEFMGIIGRYRLLTAGALTVLPQWVWLMMYAGLVLAYQWLVVKAVRARWLWYIALAALVNALLVY